MKRMTRSSAPGAPGRPFLRVLPLGWAAWSALAVSGLAGPLEDYVHKPDDHFSWTRKEPAQAEGWTVTPLELVSQQWREHLWKHNLIVVRPAILRNPDIALLYITGNSSGQ